MMQYIKIIIVLVCFSPVQFIVAQEDIPSQAVSLFAKQSAPRSQLYTIVGHFGHQKFMGFFSQINYGEDWIWWVDTGTILDGMGTGFRKLLSYRLFDQPLLFGAYCYYDTSWGW